MEEVDTSLRAAKMLAGVNEWLQIPKEAIEPLEIVEESEWNFTLLRISSSPIQSSAIQYPS